MIDSYDGKNNGIIVFDNTNNGDLMFKYLKTVDPNPQEAAFLDFISDDVIIEHFSITSSKK